MEFWCGIVNILLGILYIAPAIVFSIFIMLYYLGAALVAFPLFVVDIFTCGMLGGSKVGISVYKEKLLAT
jgi:hypothetical protein